MFNEVSRRHEKRKTTEMRKQEIEDSPQLLAKKCERMAKAIQKVSIAFKIYLQRFFPTFDKEMHCNILLVYLAFNMMN